MISEPIAGTSPTPLGAFDLGASGYVRTEHFVSGTATSYRTVGEWAADGTWAVEPDESAGFTTRLVVNQPSDPKRFNGTVVVEWLNVSAGTDLAPGWLFAHRQIMRTGAAYVGVSAQRAGIEGGGLVPGPHLKVMDPERYAPLDHPGDAFSFDIFSQSARAILEGPPVLAHAPERVLAWGASQSAVFLVTYVNAIDVHAKVFDGYLIHGRGGSGAPIDGALISAAERTTFDLAATAARLAAGHRIRTDARVPVMIVQSETDQFVLAGRTARQPDSERIRTWEIAGASHADTYVLVAAHFDDGSLPPAVLAKLLTPTTAPQGMRVPAPINGGPQQHYVLQAALAHLERWTSGQPPPATAPFEVDSGGQPRRGADGIVLGGVRTPWMDVPVAVHEGTGQRGAAFAILFGTTEPLPLLDVLTRYPGGAAEYRSRFADATQSAVKAGYLLADDEDEIVAVGAAQWPFWPLG